MEGVVSLPTRKHHFFGYGTEILDEDIDEAEDQWNVIEHVRVHGTLGTDTEGSVLGREHPPYGYWYNPGGHGVAHKYTYEEWLQGDRRTEKEKARDALLEHWRELKRQKDLDRQDREMSEHALAQSNMALRHWHARQEAPSKQRIDYELAQKVEQEERDREHERKRLWSIRTADIERRITVIVDSMDCNGRDRATMRAMLRYMNLGPGAGKRWDAVEFTRFLFATRRDDLLLQNQQDVERCYNMLCDRHMR